MQKRIGSYELNKLLGEGGMGEVWLAHDTYADRSVALKFIKPHLLVNDGFRTRFTNEARTMGKLEHDRIVTLYAVLDEEEHLALVLRFIDGKSLADKIDAEGAQSISFVQACSRDILPALDFAHQQGIIHRDIKPQNILVDRRDRSFLTDFGIAIAAFAERGTVTGHAIGTPHYMSPEQIRTPRDIRIETGGHRTDIYSFGVVLFEMLTGQLPFGQDSGIEDMYSIYHAHCNEEPKSPRAFNGDVPQAVDEVVLRCLAKDPAMRPQTCQEVLNLLEGALSNSAPARSRIIQPATVVEPLITLGDVPAAKVVEAPKLVESKPPATKAATSSKKIPQMAWLGVGGVLIAAGIGYTVITQSQKPTPPVPDRTKTESTSTLTGQGSSTRPLGANPPVIDKRRHGPSDVGKTLPPVERSGPPSNPSTEQNSQSTVEPSSDPRIALMGERRQQAEKEYLTGNRLYEEGQYCESEAHFNQAMKLFPDKKYGEKQHSAAIGCNTQ